MCKSETHFPSEPTQAEGSAMLISLVTVAILSLIAATAFRAIGIRANTTTQAASWQEALAGAEAGAESGMASLRVALSEPTMWTDPKNALTDAGAKAPWAGWTVAGDQKSATRTQSLRTASSTGPSLSATITFEAPASMIDAKGDQWYRVRATGTAGVPGPKAIDADKRNNDLRKLSLLRDRTTQTAVVAPQVSRSIEVVVGPVRGEWDRAITSDAIVKNGAKFVVDSFDSSNPAKSTNGLYDVAKRQSNGDIACNADGGDVNIGGGYVYGDVAVNGGTPKATENVTGTITNNFYSPLPPIETPVWSVINPAVTTIVSQNATLTGGSVGSPQRYKLDEISVGTSNTIHIQSQSPGQASEIEIWVDKDVKMSGTSSIVIDPEVSVKFWVGGKWEQAGGSITNGSQRASQLTVFGITPKDGTHPQWQWGTSSDFIGCINAPQIKFKVTSVANFFGAVICYSTDFGGGVGAGFHFDEALLKTGTSAGYRRMSWVEDIR